MVWGGTGKRSSDDILSRSMIAHDELQEEYISVGKGVRVKEKEKKICNPPMQIFSSPLLIASQAVYTNQKSDL